MNLNNDAQNCYAPQISAVGNNVCITYFSDIAPGNQDVFFTSSNDNGKTFSNPIHLSNTPGYVQSVQIIAVKNNIYITWMDYTSNNFDVLFTVSKDNGQTFSTSLNLTNNLDSQNPQIAVTPLELEN